MEPWQACILGLIEGITEYLPVSSTGHLLVAQHLMGIGFEGEKEKIAADTFAVCIQGGAILAVLGVYFQRVKQMVFGLLGRDREGLQLVVALLVGFFPAAIMGLCLNDWIESKLFGLGPVVFAWVLGGILILAAVRYQHRFTGVKGSKELKDLTWKLALVIGMMQCVAMWPGTSRSLMTMVGGLVMGLSISAAVEYSFLLGLVTLSAATAKKAIWKVPGLDDQYDVWFGGLKLLWETYGVFSLAVGVISAMVFAAVAVKWLVGYLKNHGLEIFGWYRVGVGVVVGTGLWLGYFR